MIFNQVLVALTLALSACALPSPHVAHNVNHHRSIAARHAAPEPVAHPEPVLVKPKRKRDLNKRCTPKASSAAVSASASSIFANSTAVPASSVFSSAAVPSVSVLPSSSALPSIPVSSSVVISSSSAPAPASSAAPVNVGNAPPTFSSSYVAPTTSAAPTSSAAPPPPPPPPTSTEAPTSTYVAPPPSSSYVPTSTAAANPSGPTWLYETNTGDATFYAAGLGACGITNTDTDYIVAVSWELFDNYPGYDGTNPNTNPVCNKQIKANYQGAEVTVTVTDRCTGCSTTSLDFTPTAFQIMAPLAVGRLTGMTWDWA